MRRSNLAFCNEKTRLLRREVYPKAKRGTPFHEPELTGICINDGLPLTPTPLPEGARGLSPSPDLRERDGVRVGFGLRPVRFMVREQYRQHQYRQFAMTERVMFYLLCFNANWNHPPGDHE